MPSPSPFVLLLSGPCGSGKSTTAIAWAESRTYPTALLDMDKIRAFVRSGRSRPDVVWDEEAQRQWHLAMDQCALLARTYVDGGFTCVIDVYAPPSPESDRWDEVLAGLDVRKVYLDAEFETCLVRNAERSGEAQVGEAALRHNWETHRWCLDQRRPDTVLNNSDLTVAETVGAIDNLITR